MWTDYTLCFYKPIASRPPRPLLASRKDLQGRGLQLFSGKCCPARAFSSCRLDIMWTDGWKVPGGLDSTASLRAQRRTCGPRRRPLRQPRPLACVRNQKSLPNPPGAGPANALLARRVPECRRRPARRRRAKNRRTHRAPNAQEGRLLESGTGNSVLLSDWHARTSRVLLRKTTATQKPRPHQPCFAAQNDSHPENAPTPPRSANSAPGGGVCV
jgi:hypothetical protein